MSLVAVAHVSCAQAELARSPFRVSSSELHRTAALGQPPSPMDHWKGGTANELDHGETFLRGADELWVHDVWGWATAQRKSQTSSVPGQGCCRAVSNARTLVCMASSLGSRSAAHSSTAASSSETRLRRLQNVLGSTSVASVRK